MDYKRLKRFRRGKGFTQEEVAKLIGISRQAFSNYERGIRVPSIDVLVKLADVYEMSLDELVGRNNS